MLKVLATEIMKTYFSFPDSLQKEKEKKKLHSLVSKRELQMNYLNQVEIL
jgi:hypothetical protein